MEQGAPRIGHQGRAGRRQRHPLGAALQQLRPHAVLELLDRHRQGRLGDMQDFGGAAVAAEFGDGDELA